MRKQKIREGFFQIQKRFPGIPDPSEYTDLAVDQYFPVGTPVPTIEFNKVDDFIDRTIREPFAWGLDDSLGRFDIVCLMYRGSAPSALMIVDPKKDLKFIGHRDLTSVQKQYYGTGRTGYYFWKVPKKWEFFMNKKDKNES